MKKSENLFHVIVDMDHTISKKLQRKYKKSVEKACKKTLQKHGDVLITDVNVQVLRVL